MDYVRKGIQIPKELVVPPYEYVNGKAVASEKYTNAPYEISAIAFEDGDNKVVDL